MTIGAGPGALRGAEGGIQLNRCPGRRLAIGAGDMATQWMGLRGVQYGLDLAEAQDHVGVTALRGDVSAVKPKLHGPFNHLEVKCSRIICGHLLWVLP